MATYYVKYRLKGATLAYSVIAATREAAIALVARSGTTGQEFDINDANLYGYPGLTPATGPTG